MMVDFYVCPKCLYFEFGDETEEELKKCPKCGSDILLVNASMEAQHLITDIWSDHGGKVASVVAIALAIFNYPTLTVDVMANERKLGRDDLVSILRKHKEITERGIKILEEIIEPKHNLNFA